MGINQISLSGRLTADPELRFTTNEKQVCSFSLAYNPYRPAGETTVFIDCEAWGSTAKYIKDYARKGQTVVVAGALDEDLLPAKGDYPEKKKPKIVVRDIQLPPKQAESQMAF